MAHYKLAHASVCLLVLLFAFSTTQAQSEYPVGLKQTFLRADSGSTASKTGRPMRKPGRKDSKGFWRPYGPGFIVSSATYWGGTIADIESTGDLYERNPRFRNSSGRLNRGKAYAVAGGLYLLTLAIERKWPRAMNALRLVVGVGRGVFGAVHNLRR